MIHNVQCTLAVYFRYTDNRYGQLLHGSVHVLCLPNAYSLFSDPLMVKSEV